LTRSAQAEFVICDYTIELIFRFLKRSLNGLHLLSYSQPGVTIHFYALLLTALLELRLKQKCVTICASRQTIRAPSEPADNAPAIAGLMIDPEQLSGARGSTFLATIGGKLKRYWKISRDWLTALRNFLPQPFTYRVVFALGRY
jgi:hypothetical protein